MNLRNLVKGALYAAISYMPLSGCGERVVYVERDSEEDSSGNNFPDNGGENYPNPYSWGQFASEFRVFSGDIKNPDYAIGPPDGLEAQLSPGSFATIKFPDFFSIGDWMEFKVRTGSDDATMQVCYLEEGDFCAVRPQKTIEKNSLKIIAVNWAYEIDTLGPSREIMMTNKGPGDLYVNYVHMGESSR